MSEGRGPREGAGPIAGGSFELTGQHDAYIIAAVLGLGLLLILVGLLLSSRKKVFLEGAGKYAPCTLIEKENISHDVRRFRFKLPSKAHVLGLPIGKHVFARVKVDGETVIRSYTPVTDVDTLGYFDLVLKIYTPLPPRFPEGGKMSQHLDSLNLGDTVDFTGPTGHVNYEGKGVFLFEHKKRVAGKSEVEFKYRPPAKKIGMIAGGTGITPMLQILRHILNKEEGNEIELWLLFANKTEDDILLQKELEKSVPELRLWYTLDNPPPNWKYGEGFISEDMLREHMPPPSAQTQILMCGPPPMIKFACVPNLEKLGFTEDMMIRF